MKTPDAKDIVVAERNPRARKPGRLNQMTDAVRHISEKKGTAMSQTNENVVQTPTKPGKKVKLGNAIGFALGDFYGGGFGQLAVFLPVFWTKFAGLEIDQTQNIVGIATMVSAFAALVVGALSDNLYRYKFGRKFGRRRFFLIAGIPVLLVTMLMWIPGLPLWLYFVVYALWIIANQMIMTPYSALPTEMTTDFNGRTMLSTTRMLFSGISNAVIPGGAAIILSALGEDHAYSYQVAMLTFMVIFCICLFAAWKSTWEYTPEEAGIDVAAIDAEAKKPFDFGEWLKGVGQLFADFFTTLRISSFRKHVLIYLLGQSFLDIFGQTWLFFVLYDLNKPAAFASALLSLSIIGEPLKPVYGWLFAKLGPRKLFSIDFGGAILGLLGLLFLWKSQGTLDPSIWNVLVYVITIWWLIFRSLTWFIPWNVFPFIPDVDELVTGKNRTGVFVGFQLFLRKLTAGFAASAIGMYLATTGFVKDADTQPVAAQNGIAMVMIGWVIAGLAIAWIISLTLPLSKKTHGILVGEIERLKAGGKKSDVDPEVKKVCEQLTGVKYEKCWPESAE
ncbi:MFS transporter [Bifidobacterium myosotis]|uniref:MFS transporter n=2 Tax=Bifidobacterium myosotis TaxID=1630166 RepID=A0A5M9ZJG4_9BIFI|nr:MFS transporter [Bifidobacterium myosotis]